MKINKLTILNINSLKGKYIIDFEKDFSENGLFLISGETGSGKTTILDAISIALYNRTPRLSSKSDIQYLMSIDTANCFSELEFEVDNILYKSYWGLKRAREKKDGNFQDTQMKLSCFKNNKWEAINGTKTQILKKIENITNLNFDKFSKTIMLAQGSFDSFLKAKGKEKSELLEKITGTQIYKKISSKVYEKYKIKYSKLDNLKKSINEEKLLTNSEIEDINRDIKIYKNDIVKIKEDVNQIANSIVIQNNIENYTNNVNLLSKKFNNLQIEKENFKEDNKILEDALKAKDIYHKIVEKEDIKKDKDNKDINIKEFNKLKDEFNRELDILNKKILDKDKEFNIYKDKLELQNKINNINEFKKNKIDIENIIKNLEDLNELKSSKTIEKEKLEELKISLSLIQNYTKAREQLEDNKECPLCGSKNHPYISNLPKIDKNISQDIKYIIKILKDLDKDISSKNNKKIKLESRQIQLKEFENLQLEELDFNKTLDKVYSEKELENLTLEISNINKEINKNNNKVIKNDTNIINIERNIKELEDKYKKLNLEIKELLVSKNFKDEQEVIESSIKDEKVIQDLENKKQYISSEIIKIESLINSNKDNLEKELKKNSILKTSTKNIEELKKEKIYLSNQVEDKIKESTILQEKINQDNKLKKEYKEIYKKIEILKNDLESWEILNSLIGQADGSKYQLFVQNLTLGHLLHLSNNHIKYLSDRYQLVKDDNTDLSISIIDKYQLNKIRSTNTLSGGETFLISLSLALGLSDLVNDKIKIDSLFLDEGFGTLDEETLNIAINTLEKLQLKGKTIGIISHVKLLQDRILNQIKLKKDATGSSLLEIIK